MPPPCAPIGRSGVYSFAVRAGADRARRWRPPRSPIPFTRCSRPPSRSSSRRTTSGSSWREQLVRIVRRTPVEAIGVALPEPARPTLVADRALRPGAPHRVRLRVAVRGSRPAAVPERQPGSRRGGRRSRALSASRRSGQDVGTRRLRARAGRSRPGCGRRSPRDTLPALEALEDVRIVCRGTRPDYRELSGDPHVTITTVETTDPDWFDLGVIVTIDGRTIPFSTLFTALAKGRRKVLLADGALLLARASLAAAPARPHPGGRRAARVGDRAHASAATRPRSGPTSRISRTRACPPCRGARPRRALRDVERVESTPLPRSAPRRAAPLPARGIRLARVPVAAPARRRARRRHGPRQDAAAARTHRPHARGGGAAPLPRGRADLGPVDVAERSGALHARTCGSRSSRPRPHEGGRRRRMPRHPPTSS